MLNHYPLKDILKVRKLKQDAALNKLNEQKKRVKKAEEKVEKQKWRIEEFKKWLPKEEERLYDQIIGKSVQKAEVNDIKARIESHRDRLAQHHDRLEKFKEEVKQAKEDLEAARKAYQDITYNIEKILQHQESWLAEYQKEVQAAQEKEVEDIPFRKKEF